MEMRSDKPVATKRMLKRRVSVIKEMPKKW